MNRQNINCLLGLEKGNWCLALQYLGLQSMKFELPFTLLNHFKFLADFNSQHVKNREQWTVVSDGTVVLQRTYLYNHQKHE